MDMVVLRNEIWLIQLETVVGTEIRKIRPCLVVSPDPVNKYLKTVVVVPITSTIKLYPTRVNCEIEGKNGQLVIDQIRAIDKSILLKPLGILHESTCIEVYNLLKQFFSL